MNSICKKIVTVVVLAILSISCTSFAASPFDIFESKAVLKEQKAIEAKLEEFDKKLAAINAGKNNPNFDAENAFNSLAEQLLEIRKEMDTQNAAYEKLLKLIENLEAQKIEQADLSRPVSSVFDNTTD